MTTENVLAEQARDALRRLMRERGTTQVQLADVLGRASAAVGDGRPVVRHEMNYMLKFWGGDPVTLCMTSEHVGIARMEATTWSCDWHLPRPHLSASARRAVFGRALVAVMAFSSLFVVAEWYRPERPATPRHKVVFTAETLDGRPVTRDEWVTRALEEL